MTQEKIKIGISSCLLGEKVRFDGNHKHNQYINKVLANYFDFTPFCPEVSIGLPVPRDPIKLVKKAQKIHCIGVKDSSLDVTDKLKNIADQQSHWHQDLYGYILKKDSPSCGMTRVKVYNNDIPERMGTGLYAQQMMENFPHLPIEEEGRLQDQGLRENFIQRVFLYRRWRTLTEKDSTTLQDLQTFHAQHKYLFMSHDQNLTKALGKLLADGHQAPLQILKEQYLEQMTTLLKIVPTRKNHMNTLQHIQGYLKTHLSSDDKQELTDIMVQYHQGILPLIVPISFLRHYFRKHPNDYIQDSYYLQPDPQELRVIHHQ